MPKYKQLSLRGAHIITKFTTSLTNAGKSSVTTFLVVAVMSTSFWAHTTRAEAPDPALATDATGQLVDGLTVDERAAKIDAYFAQYKLPAAGLGKAFVLAADREGIDWRFVAAKAFIESTGCKFIPKGTNNCFGWGGCSTAAKCIHFESYEAGIDEVTANLAGNREKTAKYYANKTLSQKMSSYNSVNPKYQPLVFGTMDKIAKMQIATPSPVLAMK